MSPELRAAQIILIFNLPSEFGECPTPLAYVRWFRRFSPVTDQRLGMYKTSVSAPAKGYAIIPITSIVRSCHLLPVFEDQFDETGTDNDVDERSHFFLNPYLRHIDFFLFRFLDTSGSSVN